ncbi:Pre-mRNA-splicing factor [Lithohypha guttulata]|uniref:Pre-mRNA-splicing factor n=1 Tax=Lithohypha guttulata TaxID=1690604 RepID=UPI002DDDE16B|nr:Pre-mRNA-splicing factor [Lithohypha guttulata]KAK5099306.1 Pre-mRNA-splicing factor [Lithohypha guttulata]
MAETLQDTPLVSPPSPSRKRSAEPEEVSTSTLTKVNGETAIEGPPAKKTKLIRRKKRPAPPQIDPTLLKTGQPPPQTGTTFNIWYNKWAGGDREDAYLSKTAAISRCKIKEHSGWTQADKTPGSFFCLFFARGICPKGHECQYLHRLPGIYDIFNPNIDCFGRDRHADYRDDMGGVGSFMRQNRTLYIGRIHVTDDIEEIVARHFQEWGEIERIRVLTARGVAFVTYVNEANSQFAKEAMAHQALDNNEILNVRWATVDPNPLSAKRELARIDEQAAEAVRRALGEKAVRQIEGRETAEEKAQRRLEAGFGLEGYEAPETVWFNKQKELEAMQQQAQLEGPQDRKLLEPAIETAAEVTPQQLTAEQQPTNGIFTSSTLAALQGRTGGAITTTTTTAPSKPSTSGLLVGYGSDDDN